MGSSLSGSKDARISDSVSCLLVWKLMMSKILRLFLITCCCKVLSILYGIQKEEWLKVLV